VDGGATFSAYNASLTTIARYGAFPTDDVWYVAAGEWPGEGSDDENNDDNPIPDDNMKHRTKKGVYIPLRQRKSKLQKSDGKFVTKVSDIKVGQSGSYEAQITKTMDGGKTFTTIFNSSNEFYFNSIDCQPDSSEWCCAVGEGFQDSTVPGARIHCTMDGGSSWNQTYFMAGNSTKQFSLMEIRFTTNNDVWALGSELGEVMPTTWFLSSADGGKTWTKDPTSLPGYSPLGLSFVDPTHAWAALDNVITQESAIAAYN